MVIFCVLTSIITGRLIRVNMDRALWYERIEEGGKRVTEIYFGARNEDIIDSVSVVETPEDIDKLLWAGIAEFQRKMT